MTPEYIMQRGVPLALGYEKYARASPSRVEIQTGATWPRPKFTTDPNLIEFHRQMWTLQESFSETAKIAHEKETSFRRQLSSGRLVAAGYKIPRHPSDLPVPIPPDVWESGKINYSESVVKGAALEFVSVRIVRATARPQKLKVILEPVKITPEKIDERRVGRPSLARQTWIAYEQLKKGGKIRFNLPMTHAIDQVRAKVKELFPEDVDGDRGLREEAIRKVIYQDFRQGQDALKFAQKL